MLSHAVPAAATAAAAAAAAADRSSKSLLLEVYSCISMQCVEFHGPQARTTHITRDYAQIIILHNNLTVLFHIGLVNQLSIIGGAMQSNPCRLI